jgi:hypothetical protein
MSMQTDVKSISTYGSGSRTIYSGRTRIRAITISYNASGVTTLRTGGETGVSIFEFQAPGVAGSVHVLIPGEGLLGENIHATVNQCNCTYFYG